MNTDDRDGRERWYAIDRIYWQAFEQTGDARVALLDDACGGDGELRRAVELLLVCDPAAIGFLETPALDLAAEMLAQQRDIDLTGRRLGPYLVEAWLGSGGMGDVYRARDGNLERDVALKVLPALFAFDADRLVRFKREAQILASLNHSNIAAIHGFEEFDGQQALVLEFVAGPTLADRVAHGPIPLADALPIARQIAEALEAAHAHGIIHRDLKPANIKVRPDGTAKVLDFGLAKAMDPAAVITSSVVESPVTTAEKTQPGMILGTTAYMSPEQAKGRAVDRRADIWAFGCVLYEMLTGKRPFDGEDVSDTLVAILTTEPDWTALPTATPAAVVRLLRRCLERDPTERLDSATSVRLDINEGLLPPHSSHVRRGPVAISGPRRGVRLPWVIAGAAALTTAAVVALWMPWRARPEPAKVSFEIEAATSSLLMQTVMALSPDGRLLVARTGSADPGRLSVRPLERTTWSVIPGTDGAGFPFWSPDSRSVGFVADGKLKTVDVLAPHPRTLVDGLPVRGYGGAWSRDGVILFAKTTGPLFRVPANGGAPVQVTQLNPLQGETAHRFPRFLPDGDHFFYLVLSTKSEVSGIYLGSLQSKGARRIVSSTARPDFAAPNLLLFLRDRTLMAQRFDPRRLDVSGEPTQVATGILGDSATGAGGFSVSDNGVLAVRPGREIGDRQLTWTDAEGHPTGTVGPPANYENPRLSPDGTRLAAFRQEDGADIWISDLERNTSTRFTFDPAVDNIPVWSPDGRSIAFSSNRDGGVFNLYRRNAGGTGDDEPLLKTASNKLVTDWSADGRFLLYENDSPSTKTDLWMLPLFGDRAPVRLLGTAFNESEGAVSPDGRWLAYSSDESGVRHVYVQTFPPTDRKWQVSNLPSGAHPRWRSDGQQLFFDARGTLQVTDVLPSVAGEFKVSAPRSLFQGTLNLSPHNFDVAEMGRRFLVVLAPQIAMPPAQPIVVTVNWTSGLQVGR